MTQDSSSKPIRRTGIIRMRILAAAFGLLSVVGAVDYVMIVTHNLVYFEYLGYGERQIAYFTGYPVLLLLLLTVGVWGTMVGSILLFVRSRFAVAVLAAALVCQAVLNAITFATRDRWDVLGPRLGTQDLIVMSLTFAFALYALHLRHRRALR